MNANELPADQLADLLDEIPVGDFESLDHHHFTRQAATMLRQQQAEIERLKALCITYIDDEWSGTSSYQAKIDEVNNERK
jgi:hypothetical protein